MAPTIISQKLLLLRPLPVIEQKPYCTINSPLSKHEKQKRIFVFFFCLILIKINKKSIKYIKYFHIQTSSTFCPIAVLYIRKVLKLFTMVHTGCKCNTKLFLQRFFKMYGSSS